MPAPAPVAAAATAQVPYFPPLQRPEDFTPAACAALMRRVAGRPDLQLEVGRAEEGRFCGRSLAGCPADSPTPCMRSHLVLTCLFVAKGKRSLHQARLGPCTRPRCAPSGPGPWRAAWPPATRQGACFWWEMPRTPSRPRVSPRPPAQPLSAGSQPFLSKLSSAAGRGKLASQQPCCTFPAAMPRPLRLLPPCPAFRTSCAGAFGMNTGVCDAHNLAWKLAAVLGGTAGPHLLASYTPERKPVGLANMALSADNFYEELRVPSVSAALACWPCRVLSYTVAAHLAGELISSITCLSPLRDACAQAIGLNYHAANALSDALSAPALSFLPTGAPGPLLFILPRRAWLGRTKHEALSHPAPDIQHPSWNPPLPRTAPFAQHSRCRQAGTWARAPSHAWLCRRLARCRAQRCLWAGHGRQRAPAPPAPVQAGRDLWQRRDAAAAGGPALPSPP